MSQQQNNGGCLGCLFDIIILILILKFIIWFFYQGGMSTL